METKAYVNLIYTVSINLLFIFLFILLSFFYSPFTILSFLLWQSVALIIYFLLLLSLADYIEWNPHETHN